MKNAVNYTIYSWLSRTDPADVARVESKTVIATSNRNHTIPTPKAGVAGQLGHWMSNEELEAQLGKRFPGSMKGTVIKGLFENAQLTSRIYCSVEIYQRSNKHHRSIMKFYQNFQQIP